MLHENRWTVAALSEHVADVVEHASYTSTLTSYTTEPTTVDISGARLSDDDSSEASRRRQEDCFPPIM